MDYFDIVADGGAVPGTDCTQIINECLTATRNPQLKPVMIPWGNFWVSPPFLTNRYVSMIGHGAGRSKIITNSNADLPMLRLALSSPLGDGVKVEGFSLDRALPSTSVTAGIGIALDNAPRVLSISRVQVQGRNRYGIDIRNASVVMIDTCIISGEDVGVRIVKTPYAFIGELSIDNCVIDGLNPDPQTCALLYQGIDASDMLDAALRVSRCHLGARGYGKAVLCKWSSNLWLRENVFENPGSPHSSQVHLWQSGNVNITDCTWSGGEAPEQDAIWLFSLPGGGNIVICGNRIMGRFRSGIVVDGLGWSDLIIANNLISHSHPDNFYQYEGISIIDPQASHITITGNIIRRFAVGLKVLAGVSFLNSAGNDFSDNSAMMS